MLSAAVALGAERPLLLHTPPVDVAVGVPMEIDGSLLHGSQVDQVVLHYRTGGGEFREAKMELQYGDVFRGVIPADRVMPPSVEYFVDGVTVRGEHLPLLGSAVRPVRLRLEGEAPLRSPVIERPAPPRETPPSVVVGERPPPRGTPSGEEPAPVRPEPRSTAPLRAPVHPATEELDDDLAVFSATDSTALALKAVQESLRAPSLDTVLTRDQMIALGVRSVYEALEFVPGLSMSRDVQGFYRVGVRGLRSDAEVLFLLNGHPLNNFYDGRAFANLPIENLARIEVTRGPGSVENGANAFLAVVNILTDESDGARGTVAYGSFDTIDAHASAGLKAGAFDFFADADYLQQKGYFLSVGADSLSNETLAQGLRGANDPVGTTHDSRQFFQAGGGASYQGENGKLTLRLRYLHETRAPLLGEFDTVSPGGTLRWDTLLGDLHYDHRLSATAKGRFEVDLDSQSIDRLFLLSPRAFTLNQTFPAGVQEKDTAQTLTFVGKASLDLTLFSGNTLTLGAEASSRGVTDAVATNFNVETLDLLSSGLTQQSAFYGKGHAFAAHRLELAVVAQDRWSIVERLAFEASLRAALIQMPVVDGQGGFSGAKLLPNLNPRAAISLAVTDGLTLKLLYAHAFRAPTEQELALLVPDNALTRGRYQGNPALKGSQLDTLELGADTVQSLGDALLTLRGGGFFTVLTDAIAAVDINGVIPPISNRDGVRVLGLDGEARIKLSARANTFVNASFFRALEVTPTSFQLLTDTPQARLNAGVTFPLGDLFDADLVVDYGAERQNLSRASLEQIRRWTIPAYASVNSQLRTELLWKHLVLALVGQNVFNMARLDDVPRPDRVPGLLPREGVSVVVMARVFE